MKHEKELLRLPAPACPGLALPEDAEHKTRNLYFAAQVEAFGQELVLGVTVFGRDRAPMRRWWMTDKETVMQSFETVKNAFSHNLNREPGRAYSACIDTELDIGCWWRSVQTVLHGTAADRRRVLRHLNARGTDVGKAVMEAQIAQRTARREAERERQKKVIRERFARLPREPEDFLRWVEDTPLRRGRWFLYTYQRGAAQEGVCSHCGKKSRLGGVRLGAEVRCPHCDSLLRCRSTGKIGRGGLSLRERAALYQRAGDEIAVRVYTVGIDVREDVLLGVKKHVWTCEEYRYFLSADGQRTLGAYSSHYGRYSIRVDSFNECGDGYGYTLVYLCPENLGELRRALGIWTPVETLAERVLCSEPESLFRQLRKRPELEYLIKLGLYRLAAWELSCNQWRSRRTALLKGKTVTELLGVDKATLRELQQADADGETLRVVRALGKCGVTARAADMVDIARLDVTAGKADTLLRMARELSLHKALRYLGQQTDANTDGDDALQLWRDYVGMARELGIDLQDGMRLFPRKLRRAHDEAAKLVRMREDAALDAKIAATADSLADLMWETKTLCIFPARAAGELFCEGKALKHCVGREHYARSMAEGRTAIFFIRRPAERDVPYVTLELDLKTWRKLQCYGEGDAWPGKAVDSFVARWIKDIVRPRRVEQGSRRKPA